MESRGLRNRMRFRAQRFVNQPRGVAQLLLEELLDLAEPFRLVPHLFQEGDAGAQGKQCMPQIMMDDLSSIRMTEKTAIDTHGRTSLNPQLAASPPRLTR
jgi:hypothetical protein